MSSVTRSPELYSSAADVITASLYCGEDADDVVSWDSEARIFGDPPSPGPAGPPPPPPSDEAAVARLIEAERSLVPRPDYVRRCRDHAVDAAARQDSINWILRVHGHYGFRPVTALLSISYLDRFLSCHSLQPGNGSWPFQLLSVACLSLAAKMEELYVPLLLDLQVSEPRFVFEPKTVQRMELWVMSKLGWRLRSVTPLDYLDFLISELPSSPSASKGELYRRVYSVSSDLILGTTRVIDFLGFTPSTIAAAAVLCAAREADGSPATDADLPSPFREKLNKEMLRSCHQLMEEYLIDRCPSGGPDHGRSREAPQPPPSPVGVLDAAACGSCDSRSMNPPSGGYLEAEPTPPPPLRPPKRPRLLPRDVQQSQMS